MEEKPSQIKVILLGDSGVGKSSLLLRFVKDEFNEFHEPTLGASFGSKLHQYREEKSVLFQVWDTAGQEKYKSIAPIYYRDSKVAICIYDITNRDSLKVMKSWVAELQDKGPKNILIAIVGSKIDKIEEQKVPFKEGKEFAESIDAIFKLTSAKEGRGINELFSMIAQKYFELLEKEKEPPKQQTTHLTNEPNPKKKKPCC